MTISTEKYRDAWVRITERHLGMSDLLLTQSYFEGVVFHTYHAFESISKAILVVKRGFYNFKGTNHKKILSHCKNVVQSNSTYASKYSRLCVQVESLRDVSLYYDGGLEPSMAFKEKDSKDHLQNVREIVRDLKLIIFPG